MTGLFCHRKKGKLEEAKCEHVGGRWENEENV